MRRAKQRMPPLEPIGGVRLSAVADLRAKFTLRAGDIDGLFGGEGLHETFAESGIGGSQAALQALGLMPQQNPGKGACALYVAAQLLRVIAQGQVLRVRPSDLCAVAAAIRLRVCEDLVSRAAGLSVAQRGGKTLADFCVYVREVVAREEHFWGELEWASFARVYKDALPPFVFVSANEPGGAKLYHLGPDGLDAGVPVRAEDLDQLPAGTRIVVWTVGHVSDEGGHFELACVRVRGSAKGAAAAAPPAGSPGGSLGAGGGGSGRSVARSGAGAPGAAGAALRAAAEQAAGAAAGAAQRAAAEQAAGAAAGAEWPL
jgi:hypothetical protein